MKPHRANPRDANEQALLTVAGQLGGQWHEAPPLDGWVWCRGQWTPVEIKLPEREGTAYEYTPLQKRFFSFCSLHKARWFVWRTAVDVIRDLGGRVSA